VSGFSPILTVSSGRAQPVGAEDFRPAPLIESISFPSSVNVIQERKQADQGPAVPFPQSRFSEDEDVDRSDDRSCRAHNPLSVDTNISAVTISSHHFKISARLRKDNRVFNITCVIDSAALGVFISPHFVSAHSLRTSPLVQPLRVTDVDNRPLPMVTSSVHAKLSVGDNSEKQHLESIEAYVTNIGHFDMILGLPWLVEHDPQISWRQARMSLGRCPSSCKASEPVFVSGEVFESPSSAPRMSSLTVNEELASGVAPDQRNAPLSISAISLQPAEDFLVDWTDGIFCGALAILNSTRADESAVATSSSNESTLTSSSSTLHCSEPGRLGPASPFPQSRFSEDEDAGSMDVSPGGLSSAPCNSLIPKEIIDLAEVFSKSKAEALPEHRPYDISLPLKEGAIPPFGPLYNLSAKEMEVLHEWLEEQLTLGHIRTSSSAAASPILFVKKKDGTLRLCVDYRGLNAITIRNRNPLPRIDQLLDLSRKAQYYSKIDLRTAYNLLRVASGEEWKTAFRTHFGLYESLVMPFGLTNAPSVFQQFITDVLRDHIGPKGHVAVYLDDILVYSNTLEEHWRHVRGVLKHLLAAKLYAKLEKCEFARDQVEFLGFIIGRKSLQMDPAKLNTIKQWPIPSSVKDIESFLGFCNFYRRFISHYAKIARPLTLLTHNNAHFDLSDPSLAYKAFRSLQASFLSAPLLRHFDPDQQIRLITDSSGYALAVQLCQRDDDGHLHPVAFYSRQLSPAEVNYQTYDQEMLAVVNAFAQFRHWCHGSPHPVKYIRTIVTSCTS